MSFADDWNAAAKRHFEHVKRLEEAVEAGQKWLEAERDADLEDDCCQHPTPTSAQKISDARDSFRTALAAISEGGA